MAYRTHLRGPVGDVLLQQIGTAAYEKVVFADPGTRCDTVAVYNPAGSDVLYISVEPLDLSVPPLNTTVTWAVPAGSADLIPVDLSKVDIYARMGSAVTDNVCFRRHVCMRTGE